MCQIAADEWQKVIQLFEKDGRQRLRLDLDFGWAEWDAVDQVIVGDRVLPVVIEVVAAGGPESTAPTLRMVITMVDRIPLCTLLAIERRENGRGVQSSDLRGIRLDDWIQDIVAQASMHVDLFEDDVITAVRASGGPEILAARKAVRQMRRSSRRKVTGGFLAEVADVYRDNQETGKPTRAVEIAFGTSHRTAARWVSLARERGLL